MGSTRRSIAVFGALTVMCISSPGQTFVISNFTEAIGGSLDLEASDLAAAYLIGTLASAASLTHAGRLADRIGPRYLAAVASVGLALAGFALSRAAGFVSLAAAFYLLRFFGQGVLTLSSSHALALRFDAKLGSVEGIKGATFSGAIAAAPQIAVALIESHGWREAAWRMSAGAGLIGLFAAFVLLDKDPKKKPLASAADAAADAITTPTEPSFTLSEARRTRAFWILVGSSSYLGAGLTAVHFLLQTLLGEAGLGEEVAAATFVSFAASGLLSTLVGGVLVDRKEPARILATGLVLLLIGMAGTALAPTPVLAHAGMAALGIGHGLMGAVGGTTLARFFGRAHHGAIRGASSTAVVTGAALGPYLAGVLAGFVGGYSNAVVVMTLAALPLPFLAWTLRRP
ncbi:putative MFS-type transporter YhjX [Planctomycetes bacterium Poly30]|uniref:Putative MFS-type transporter YhjX n=1 Tax=Saltatorellus ferox TaxID=2528018 RepID=A0A518ENP4_9BACT|nr:putative MFS-type transporter YhjX [Planctomycetes bacterium Poly30]